MGSAHPLVELNVSFKFEGNPSISKGVIERTRIGDRPTDGPTRQSESSIAPPHILWWGIISNEMLHIRQINVDMHTHHMMCETLEWHNYYTSKWTTFCKQNTFLLKLEGHLVLETCIVFKTSLMTKKEKQIVCHNVRTEIKHYQQIKFNRKLQYNSS